MNTPFKLVFLLKLYFVFVSGQDTLERSQKLSDRVSVGWTVDFSKESVTFEVTAETRGFVGFGLSPAGGMDNADVVIGGVDDDGQPYFTDRFATGKMEPKIDDHADWMLLRATENSTHTTLLFNRSLETCDSEDLPITNDTTRFIWSLGATDEIVYHQDRGAASVSILDPPPPLVDISKFEIWDISVNTTMPTADTAYWCTVHRSPNYTSKRHIVGFQIKLDNAESLEHNHHLNLHRCPVEPGSEISDLLEGFLGKPGGHCYEQDGSGIIDILGYCAAYTYVWARGGLPLFLPEHVGMSLNDGGVQEFYLVEIHYDNPKVLEGVTYETGIQIFVTDEIREEEVGLLMGGHISNIAVVVPPESESYVIAGHCSSHCTQTQIPPEGLNVFNVLLHSHLAGRQLKLRHFRPGPDGQFKELPWIFDSNYDFNYQQNKALRENMIILPGDHLTYECTYNSMWRDPPSVTLGGLTTRHEMCEVFLLYYPKLPNLDLCASQYPLENLLDKFGILQLDEMSDYDDPTVLSPPEMAQKNYSTVLSTMIDWTPQFREELQNMTRFNDHLEFCYWSTPPSLIGHRHGQFELPNDHCKRSSCREDPIWTTYPSDIEEFVPPNQCDKL